MFWKWAFITLLYNKLYKELMPESWKELHCINTQRGTTKIVDLYHWIVTIRYLEWYLLIDWKQFYNVNSYQKIPET